MKKIKFDIQGMTCSSCSAHVERAVKKLNGIQRVNVNLLSNNMIVEYDENQINNQNIIQTVIDAGYSAKVSNEEKTKVNNNEQIQKMKVRLIISICFLIPLMFIAMNHSLGEKFTALQLMLLVPIVYVNRNYFIVGIKRLLKGTPNMDSLVAIGSGAAITYGIFNTELYFESAGMILTLITVGKYLETKSKGKTSEAISKLMNLAPKTALVVRDGKEQQINIEEIKIDDIVVIKPGGNIPVDGTIIEGNTSIDQSSITGESIPVEKTIGDNIISGTINKNGSIKIKATKVGNDTTLSQIIKLVQEASNSKAPISRLADKVSGIFVPIVICIAIIATIFWIIQGQSFEFALSIGIAVLVISCPCALGLATPVAIMVGTGKAAQNGILIKSAESLELLHLIDTVVLDKTGTITQGKPEVTDIISLIDEKELLTIASSLEKESEHPLAEAVIQKAENTEKLKVENFKTIPGRGVKGTIKEINYFGGNIQLMKENNIHIGYITNQTNKLEEQGKTILYFSNNKEVIGIIAVADTIKETSYQAIKELKNRNIDIVMLTGDNKTVAKTIGEKLQVDKVISEVLPQDKEREVARLQGQGRKVAFVGDGINDSPALVKADVGLAIAAGTDIAVESADVVLMKNSLLDVVTAISLSKAVIKNIKMNLFWAFFYNIVGIPVAAGVFYLSIGLKLNPMIGAAAMSFSSVCVVANALRLRKFKSNYNNCELKCPYKYEEEKKMNKKIVNIEGMQCNHCKMSVEKALMTIEGVQKVEVNLENKNAIIEFENEINENKIKEVIEEVGFKIV